MTDAPSPTIRKREENDRLGEVTGPREVTFVRLLPGPIERVWAFLVEGDKRKRWLAGGDIEPRVGGLAKLIFHNSELTAPGETIPGRFEKYSGVMESQGRVTVWDPPRRLAFTWWGEVNETSEVAFNLEETPDGRVRLTLVHGALKDRNEMLSVSGSWHAHLGLLVAVVKGRTPERFWTAVETETERTYERIILKE